MDRSIKLDGVNVLNIRPRDVIIYQGSEANSALLVLEGECMVYCDLDALTKADPQLTEDTRAPVLNLDCLKRSLERKIIPHKSDHDLYQIINKTSVVHNRNKALRIVKDGDFIGDIEYCLSLPRFIFSVRNTNKPLKLLSIHKMSMPKFLKQYQMSNKDLLNVVECKITTYMPQQQQCHQQILPVLFHNLYKLLQIRKMKFHSTTAATTTNTTSTTSTTSTTASSNTDRIKSAPSQSGRKVITDFAATLKLYGASNVNIVPSCVPDSMRLMWRTKQQAHYWDKRIKERTEESAEANEKKMNYFKSFHQSEARSLNKLKNLNKTEDIIKEPIVDSHTTISLTQEEQKAMLMSTERIPVNNPLVRNIWTLMRAVTKFKNFSETLKSRRRIAKSKEQIRKMSRSYSNLDNKLDDEAAKNEPLDFDKETGDRYLSQIELRVKTFLSTLPRRNGKDDNVMVSELSRYSLKSKTDIPQLGGTVLVRLKPCEQQDLDINSDQPPQQQHVHVRQYSLPRDALATLQKYRSSLGFTGISASP